MTLKASDNGLVPLFFLKAYDGSANVAGDIAGYPPATAQKLIDAGYAEAYSKSKHDKIVTNRQRSMEAILSDRNAATAQLNTSHFSPAELLHEYEEKAAALRAELGLDNIPMVPSDSGTRQQIEERSPVVEAETIATPAMTRAKTKAAVTGDTPPVAPEA